MHSDINNGIVAGLVGGVVFGIMMQMMNAPTPEGGQMPMMAMVAKVVRSDSIEVGWMYHLFNSAVIGAIFGWLLCSRSQRFTAGLGWGAIWIRMVDPGGIDLNAAVTRDDGFCAASDGADATGRDGKPDRPSHLRCYSWRRLCHADAGIIGPNAAWIEQ